MLLGPMQLHELFRPDDLIVGFHPADKWEAIENLVDHLVERGKIDAASGGRVLEQVQARERSMSTGMERGIAIPHAAVDQIDEVLACMGIVSDEAGLAFESIDAQPARLIVLLVIPRSQKLLHIRTLADVARVLGIDEVRAALIAAETPEMAWEALSAGDAANHR
jgi:mannitol/fructose-specific phosphotransferase system IIA component (Ntr-type)